MLEHEGIYNDLSPKLRKKLEERIESFGKNVRYKFKLERRNPDPQKYNGEFIYPSLYCLHPVQWKITDNDEDRNDKQKIKNIGVIESVKRDERGNLEYRFKGARIPDIRKGILYLDLTVKEDMDMAAALELHPKTRNGLFPNKQIIPVLERIDEAALAKEKRAERSERKKALDAVEEMSDAEIVEFADAMTWDSTVDIDLLRNQVEDLAEKTPIYFNDIVKDKKVKIQAIIKRAIDNKVFGYNPAEGTLSWMNTGQLIVNLGRGTGEKEDVIRFAEWFDTAGKKADEVLKKVKAITNKKVEA